MNEEEILKLGYKTIASNLYEKDGELYVQHAGEIKPASELTEEQLKAVTDLAAYKKNMEKFGEKKETKAKKEKNPSKHTSTSTHSSTNANVSTSSGARTHSNTNVVVVRDKNEAHDIMNVKDDEQVLEEIRGNYLSEFVYSFETKEKRKVTGLSWAGTKEIVRRAGNIAVEDLQISETEDAFRVKAKATDLARNVTMFGVAEQSKKLKLKDGKTIDDSHSLSKAVSRAQRNACRALIPEVMIKAVIEEFLSKKKEAA